MKLGFRVDNHWMEKIRMGARAGEFTGAERFLRRIGFRRYSEIKGDKSGLFSFMVVRYSPHFPAKPYNIYAPNYANAIFKEIELENET